MKEEEEGKEENTRDEEKRNVLAEADLGYLRLRKKKNLEKDT